MKNLKMFQPALLLAVLCLTVTLLLAATNELTKGPIAEQAAEASYENKLAIFPEAASFEEIELTKDQVSQMTDKDISILELSRAVDSEGKNLGYVIVTASRGYAGNIVTTVGIGSDSKVIMVSAAAADDTPGLGKRVEKKSFTGQFTGLDTNKETNVNGDGETSKIDAISGATISSKGASLAVNKAFGAYTYLTEQGVI